MRMCASKFTNLTTGVHYFYTFVILFQESRDKFKGWVSVSSQSGAIVDVSYKKVGDGHPLRLWKCAVDVEAPPVEVLNRVLRER